MGAISLAYLFLMGIADAIQLNNAIEDENEKFVGGQFSKIKIPIKDNSGEPVVKEIHFSQIALVTILMVQSLYFFIALGRIYLVTAKKLEVFGSGLIYGLVKSVGVSNEDIMIPYMAICVILCCLWSTYIYL